MFKVHSDLVTSQEVPRLAKTISFHLMMVINNFHQIMHVLQDWFLEASDLKTVSRCCDLPTLILSFSLTSSGSLISLILLAFSGRFKSLTLFAFLGHFTSLILLASSRSSLLTFLYGLIYAWRSFISQLAFLRSFSFYLNKERILCSLIITLIIYV